MSSMDMAIAAVALFSAAIALLLFNTNRCRASVEIAGSLALIGGFVLAGFLAHRGFVALWG